MKVASLDKAILSLIKQKIALANMGYDHPDYDEVEENLHEKEDDFTDIFGEYLEKALQQCHDLYCNKSDVLNAIAYIPKEYKETEDEELGVSVIEVGDDDGILIDLNDFPNLEARMLILPSPTRIVIFSSAGEQEIWWAKDE